MMNARNISFVCLSVIFAACEEDPSGPGHIQALNFALNSSAQYTWSVVEADSLADTVAFATDTLQTRVASINDMVGAYTDLIRMEAFSIPHYIATTQVWYKQYPDSLVEVAYSSAGATPVVLPKRVGKPENGRANLAQGNGDYIRMPLAVRWALKARGIEDSVIERTEKRTVYRYPLSVGSAWTSFSDPFLETRQVEAYENVVAGSQVYWCAKVRTSLPTLAPDLEWYDYVSSEILVKRIIRIPGILFSDSDDPDAMNGRMVSFTETLNLMD